MVSTRESVAIQLEQVYYLTKDAKEFAVLIKDQGIADALSKYDFHHCWSVWCRRLVDYWFTRSRASYATGNNGVAANALKLTWAPAL